jgi:hypothetical protein
MIKNNVPDLLESEEEEDQVISQEMECVDEKEEQLELHLNTDLTTHRNSNSAYTLSVRGRALTGESNNSVGILS